MTLYVKHNIHINDDDIVCYTMYIIMMVT